MSDELEREIRERFQRAALPTAPDRLRDRVTSVTEVRPATSTGSRLPRAVAWLAPLTAVLVVAVGVALTRLGAPAAAPGSPQAPVALNWGPLAVADHPERLAARSEGRLVLTARCAFLEEGDGTRSVIVWPAGQTHWDASLVAVTFERQQSGERVQLHDGQELEFGGAYRATEAGPVRASSGGFEWLATPAPDCATPQQWLLSDVEAHSLAPSP